MGLSLGIDNDDIPRERTRGTRVLRKEIDNLYEMSGMIDYNNGNTNNGKRAYPIKKNFDLLG